MLSTVLHTTPKKRTKNSVFNRFGFQNDEKDDEVYGAGNSYTAEFWQYDARLGRRWNVDPVVKLWESPYAVFANNPLWFRDVNGTDTSFATDADRKFVMNLIDPSSNDYSKRFAKKFDQLAKSETMYRFESIAYDPNLGYTGKIEKGEENSINIFFSKGGDRFNTSAQGGRSKYGVLFEETYHAWEYDNNLLDINNPSIENEARAWKFASFAPGTKLYDPYFDPATGKTYQDRTVMGRINEASIQKIIEWFAHGMPTYTDPNTGVGYNGIKGAGHYSTLPKYSVFSKIAGGMPYDEDIQ